MECNEMEGEDVEILKPCSWKLVYSSPVSVTGSHRRSMKMKQQDDPRASGLKPANPYDAGHGTVSSRFCIPPSWTMLAPSQGQSTWRWTGLVYGLRTWERTEQPILWHRRGRAASSRSRRLPICLFLYHHPPLPPQSTSASPTSIHIRLSHLNPHPPEQSPRAIPQAIPPSNPPSNPPEQSPHPADSASLLHHHHSHTTRNSNCDLIDPAPDTTKPPYNHTITSR
ncbi:hypothetical protein E2P81_ATG05621 [Venturia nashicola]|nr:hypothetical protein E2P81_ATG05621 [Venturia nashicola]